MLLNSFRCLVLALSPLLGCTDQPIQGRQPPKLPKLNATMLAAQRSTSSVPGSEDKLKLTIDDITRGQVIASLSHADGAPVLSPASMKSGDSRPFLIGSEQYRLTLVSLNNELIGDDTAEFRIAPPSELTETKKIEMLIDAVERLDGAKFIRNGSDYAPDEAASHLRRKWEAAGDRVKTADAFIEHLGARSSATGEPYQIRKADGEVIESETFLRETLAEIEKQPERP